MSTSIPCTVQLLCRNNADNIGYCLDTLKDFAEVIVQDGRSTDGTREIAARYPNVRIMDQNPALLDADGRIADFSAMRNESIAAAKFDWILVVDADEGIREDLRDEVQRLVEQNVPGVFRAFRRFYVNGEKIERCAGYPAYQIRFFHRSLTAGYHKPIHERLRIQPDIVIHTLKSELPVPLPPPAQLEAKYARYLNMEVLRVGTLRWSKWFQWIFLRNLRSAAGLSVLVFLTWITPGKGKRMPFAYDWQAIRHSLQTIVATFPLTAKNR